MAEQPGKSLCLDTPTLSETGCWSIEKFLLDHQWGKGMNTWQRKGEFTPFALVLAGGREEGMFTLPKPGIQVLLRGM